MLITRLPRDSLTKECLAQDEEFATRVLEQADDPASRGVRLSEFSPEVEALHAVIDRLGDVVLGLVRLGNGRASPIPPMPRPVTAIDRVRDQQRREEHRALVARIVRPT